MRFIALLLVLCGVTLGSVAGNSEHPGDAAIISYGLAQMGFTPTVQIATVDCGTCYFVLYYDDWYDADVDLNKLLYALFGCAAVSEITDWRSELAVILFENKTISMTTEDARYLYNYMQENEADSYAIAYLFEHVTVVESGLSDI